MQKYPPNADAVELVGCNWNDPLPEGLDANTTLYCVDYCFQPGVLLEALGICKAVHVLDHHETSAQWLAEVHDRMAIYDSVELMLNVGGGSEAYSAVLDQTRSGCGIVAELVQEFHPDHPEPPEFLLDIEDRDLWRFSRPTTRDVFAAVTSHPYTIEAWDELEFISRRHRGDLVTEGMAINRFRDRLIAQCVDLAYEIEIRIGASHDGLQDLYSWIPCADAPYAIGSDVAGELAKQSPHKIAAYSINHGYQVQYGLRAVKDSGATVNDIAGFYGGGGHPEASGFRVGQPLESRGYQHVVVVV